MTLRIGDLVEIKDGTHWSDGPEKTRLGFILGAGEYHKSYIILFTTTGKEEQFHGGFIKLVSIGQGEEITFVRKI